MLVLNSRDTDRCLLCRNVTRSHNRKRWDIPVSETRNFLAVPSLGSIVPGWVLIVPKEHFISIGSLPQYLIHEMNALKLRLADQIATRFGPVCAFEHGPSQPGKVVGCGVDHAHLHLVPITFDLAAAAEAFLPSDVVWSDAGLSHCRAAFDQGLDYLYLEQPMGKGRLALNSQFGSQVFRKAIASYLGIPEEYNWRQFPQETNISLTVNRLRDSLAVEP